MVSSREVDEEKDMQNMIFRSSQNEELLQESGQEGSLGNSLSCNRNLKLSRKPKVPKRKISHELFSEMFPFLPLSSIFLFLHCEGLSAALASSGVPFSVISGRAFSGLRTISLSSFSLPYSPCTLNLEHTSHDAPGSTSTANFPVARYSSAFKPQSVLNGYKVTNRSGTVRGGRARKEESGKIFLYCY